MLSSSFALLNDAASGLKGRIFGTYVFLILFNLAAWVLALISFGHSPVLLGTAFLAYSFGLRHAVDADHIAAIDNCVRKLMQEGKRPVAVGLMFSLGHSAVVILASLLLVLTTMSMQHRMEAFHEIGGIIGTLVSAFFLLLIAALNLNVLISVWRKFRDLRQGKPYVEEEVDLLLSNRGFLARILQPMFRLVTRSWHLFPLGFLFGLGFDTATEIALLGMTATQSAQGMSLVDTTDGVLMLGAYGWAFIKPVRKLYYNITITALSVLVAVVVGSIEVLGLLADKLSLQGPFWDGVGINGDHFGALGYLIIGLFVVGWVVSLLVYKWRGYDALGVTEGTEMP